MRVDPYVIEAGTGPAVVLLHAFPLNASMWSAQREALSGSYRVICPDQRGFGGTQLGHDEPSLDEVADDVVAMLEARGVETFVLGGLSMGGYVAMALLRRHAERVRAVILADTKAGADTPEAVANRMRVAERALADGNADVLVEEMLPKLVGATTKASRPLVYGRVKALVERAPAYAIAWAQRAVAARPDSFDTLRAVSVPTLVVGGDEDEISPPAEAQAIAEAVPGAASVTIAGAGHLTAVETPEEFNAAVAAFLASL